MKRIADFIRSVLAWVAGLFGRRPRPLQAKFVNELPARLKKGFLYLEGEPNNSWLAAMICPCGCGATLEMNLLPDDEPNWQFRIHQDGTPTLHPSVWRKIGCRSHFWLRHGKIMWCDEYTSA